MPSYARKEIVADGEVGIYHCVNRCVRRAWLCGKDPVSGKSYDHRRDWIQDRLEELAGIFAMVVLGFAVMANHVHVVVRTRPDVATGWSAEEVAARWWRLFPKRRDENKRPADPLPHELTMLTGHAKALTERRGRLSSLSWFMRCLCEPIARRANKDDQCSGRFWEGRFKSQKLLDEAAVLACSVYVDLNPIRAGIAKTPESSRHTSAHVRISSRVGRRRASNKGFLSMRLEDYLKILDWTGRQIRRDKRSSIPAEMSPILVRLGLSDEYWIDCVKNFGRWFHRAAGSVSALSNEAARAGKHWLQGVSRCGEVFA